MNTLQTRESWRTLLCVVVIAIVVLIPRVIDLNRFVTIDERKWLARSGNFYQALSDGKFADTFQREHPGVTIMWAGTAGFLRTYPAYVDDIVTQLDWRTDEMERTLAGSGQNPLSILAAGRLVVVLITTLILIGIFLYASRLFGLWPAFVGTTLLALDPFHLALSRLLHPDALLGSLMLLSLLAFLTYLYRGRYLPHLILSGIVAGAAWLTKSPALFLAPIVALLALADGWRRWGREDRLPRKVNQDIVWPLMLWTLAGTVVFVLAWPAMWVDPVETVTNVIRPAFTYAVEGHDNPIFVNGSIVMDAPGILFYPFVFLWRTTPAVVLGLILLAFRFRALDTDSRRATAALLLYTLLFMLFMSSGAKKIDRYLLPSHTAVDLAAGIGWVYAARWAITSTAKTHVRYALVGLGALALVLTAGTVLRTFPYYLSYYNPLLGGSRLAPEAMMIGWGEGLDQAARYLNDKEDADTLRVASWYSTGPLSYLFEGETLGIFSTDIGGDAGLPLWTGADYVVLYANQWQRRLPSAEMLAYFDQQEPEHVVRLNGIEYARIYNLSEAPAPAHLNLDTLRHVDWDNTIRFIGDDIDTTSSPNGTSVEVTYHLQNIGMLDRDLNVLLRLVGQDERELRRSEGWPLGQPTSSWRHNDIWSITDTFLLVSPPPEPSYYRLELQIYDPKTFVHLNAMDVQNKTPIGDTLVLDYVQVGGPLMEPASPLTPPLDLGDRVRLRGVDLSIAQGDDTNPNGAAIARGQFLHLDVVWEALRSVSVDYTVFVHLIGPDGNLIAQRDKQPVDGFFPTSYWRPGEQIRDSYTLAVPPDAPAGTYHLNVGMYDVSSGQRLPVSQDGIMAPEQDTIAVATLDVR